MKWKQLMQNLGILLLVSVFALLCAVAIWKLSGGQENLDWDREIALAERCDLLASSKLGNALLTETGGLETEEGMLAAGQERVSRQSEGNSLSNQNSPRLLAEKPA